MRYRRNLSKVARGSRYRRDLLKIWLQLPQLDRRMNRLGTLRKLKELLKTYLPEIKKSATQLFS